ncbi:LuxR C-terminal-related transcriptional regulator [Granulicoccus phenolivorans]|uniref:LuxR C-terminal-related transcriptional regulator n=1 Tax=Granulicoccus phenolivorans TaxID=266854 RepID=UPI00138B056E|nr:LuxR C-terminal-related transcriptional regulator [Granulicoccus phenolivorans]
MPISAATRFQAPLPVSRWLSRPRMDALLRQLTGRKLALVHAPAGYGKSTLAAQWMQTIAARGSRTAWLSLDEDDDRPLWFLRHLLECFERIHPDIDENARQMLEERPEDAERYLLPLLINAVQQAPERTVIVLDDWHQITDRRTRNVLARLIDDSGEKLAFIVTSRTAAGLPLSSLRVHDQLVEVDPQVLRFDEHESQQFLVEMKGIDLSQAELAELHSKIEGWVAALQLTSLSLRNRADVGALLVELGSRQHGVAEYLAENVLDLLEPRLREFLLRTSVLSRVNAELAAVLTEQPDAEDQLERALVGDLFLQRLGATGGWFRYHHLFADFLRDRLQHEHPEIVADLHARAARWYHQHRMLSLAVDHAILAGEFAYATDIVEQKGRLVVEHSQMSTLLALVEKLPPEEIRGRARLQVALAWAYCLLHFPIEAEEARTALARALAVDRTLSADERFQLSRESIVVGECVLMYRDVVSTDDRLSTEVLDEADRLDAWTVSVAANVQTFIEINRDRAAAGAQRQHWAQQHHRQVTGCFSKVYGDCFAGLIAFHDLNTPLARHHWESAFRIGTEGSGAQSHAARLALGLLGKLHYNLGNVAVAEEMFEESLRIGHRAGVVDFMFPVYESLALIRSARGDTDGALAVLEMGERAGHDLSLVRLWSRMATTRARLGLPAERPMAGPDSTARERALLTDEAVRFDLARAASTRAPHRDAALIARAEELIARSLSHANRFQAHRDQLDLLAMMEACGDQSAAENLLRAVLEDFEISGLRQPVADGGPLVREVSQRLLSRPVHRLAGCQQWLGTLWETTPTPAVAAPAPAPEPVEPSDFNEREREILELVDAGYTNREISERLFIGVNTVKWYLRKLYRMLGVTSREECAQKAQELSVIASSAR